MIYADNSCLLKVLRPEPLSTVVWRAIEAEELKVSRLMTHDEGQAKAALEAGFKVVRPGCD